MPQAYPVAQPIQLPFLRRDLIVSAGRVNYNANLSWSPNGDDMPREYAIGRPPKGANL